LRWRKTDVDLSGEECTSHYRFGMASFFCDSNEKSSLFATVFKICLFDVILSFAAQGYLDSIILVPTVASQDKRHVCGELRLLSTWTYPLEFEVG
jgi:hypothetical protein